MMQFPSATALGLISLLRPLPKGLTRDDFTLASYPKSGNTWFRFVFAHLVANQTKDETEVNFHTIERFSPAVGGLLAISDFQRANAGAARPIKTHYNWSARYSGNRAVLLVRDPIKCLPAYADYLAEAHRIRYSSMETFLSSWRHGLPAWISFHRSWLRHANFVIRYDDLIAEPDRWFLSLVTHLGLPYKAEEIAIALQQSSRNSMKRAEEMGDPYHDAGYTFVRGEGENRNILPQSDEQQATIEERAGALYATIKSGPADRR